MLARILRIDNSRVSGKKRSPATLVPSEGGSTSVNRYPLFQLFDPVLGDDDFRAGAGGRLG